MLSSCIYSLFKNNSTCSYEFASEYRYAHIPLTLLSYAVIVLFLFSFLSILKILDLDLDFLKTC